MSVKVCPKCGKSMTAQEYTLALPGYIDPKFRKPTGERVSVQQGLPIHVYCCLQGCRYIELYEE
jgi:predicted nucleic-acid-binding Zn-ribbon protein